MADYGAEIEVRSDGEAEHEEITNYVRQSAGLLSQWYLRTLKGSER